VRTEKSSFVKAALLPHLRPHPSLTGVPAMAALTRPIAWLLDTLRRRRTRDVQQEAEDGSVTNLCQRGDAT
jgi:hypothetical protein